MSSEHPHTSSAKGKSDGTWIAWNEFAIRGATSVWTCQGLLGTASRTSWQMRTMDG
jgi:hypothetical protein